MVKIKEARYSSNAGYKTMDLLTVPDSVNDDFEIVYLETGEADAPNNTTTQINRLILTQAFMATLKQLVTPAQ